MANDYTDVKLVSGGPLNGTTDAEAQGKPVFSAPIPGVATNYVLVQPFAQQLTDFVALPLNTPHPDYPTYLLVEESEKQYLGGGEIRWNRKYAMIPAQHFEPSTIVYNFIGYTGVIQVSSTGALSTNRPGRNRVSLLTKMKVQLDYFVVGGADYPLLGNIPIIQPQLYLIAYGPGGINFTLTDYLTITSTPGFWNTVPDRDTYESWVAADAATADSYHIVAECNLTRWMGNIIRRETKYLKAL